MYDEQVAAKSDDNWFDCSILDDCVGCSVDNVSDFFLRRFLFGMTGIEDGGSGMFVESDQDVVLTIDEDEDDDGDTGEPPALLPFSQLVFDDISVDDGRRASPERLDDEPVELLGDRTLGRVE